VGGVWGGGGWVGGVGVGVGGGGGGGGGGFVCVCVCMCVCDKVSQIRRDMGKQN